MTAKLYGFDRSFLHDTTERDPFVIDMVRAEDYVKLEAQVAALREQVRALAAENVALKSVFNTEEISEEAVEAFTETAIMDHDWDDTGSWSWVDNDSDVIRAVLAAIKPETPATDAALREIRAQGIHFAANRLLAAWESGFIDDTPAMAYDISGAVLSAIEFLPNADEGEFKRDYADEVRARIRAGGLPNV